MYRKNSIIGFRIITVSGIHWGFGIYPPKIRGDYYAQLIYM